MLTGELKSKIDAVWNDFWSGESPNPLEVIEQLTYLLFIKGLDETQTRAENKASTNPRPSPDGNGQRPRAVHARPRRREASKSPREPSRQSREPHKHRRRPPAHNARTALAPPPLSAHRSAARTNAGSACARCA